MLYSEMAITEKKEKRILRKYILFLTIIIAISSFDYRVDETTNWTPVWGPIALSASLFYIFTLISYQIFLKIHIYATFKNKLIKKKWISYVFAFILYNSMLILLFISNYVNQKALRDISLILTQIWLILMLYLLYYGLGKGLLKKVPQNNEKK
ncbi:MAG: hypothetical protein ACTSVV_03660 [Promethearchaeota archaeon]